MVRKKRIKEFDEFDWVKDVNPEYSIENIISKKIHFRNNNLGELEDLGHDLTSIDKSKVILGKIRWTDYFVVEGIDSKTNEALVHLYPNKRKSKPLSYPIDEVETLVRIGVWVVMGDDGEIFNESEGEWGWVNDTTPMELMDPQSFVGKSFGYGDRIIKQMEDKDLTNFHHKEYFTIESIDENGNLILTKHHPIYGESHDSTTTIKNLIEFIDNGAWIWV